MNGNFNIKVFAPGALILLLIFAQSNSIAAQEEEKAAGILGAAVGLFAAAYSYDQFLEYLELQAVQYLLEEKAEGQEQSFRVKVFKVPNQKFTDVSRETMIVYRVNVYDTKTQAEVDRKVLFMHTSPGWINEYGIDYDVIEWVEYSQDEWNQMFARFIDISTPVKVEGITAPFVRVITEDDFVLAENQFFLNRLGAENTRRIKYFEISGEGADVRLMRISERGFEYGEGLEGSYIPHYNIGRDQYVAGPFGEGVQLVANENALGFYRSSTGRLVQMKRSIVNAVHKWVNDVSDLSTDDQLARSMGLKNAEELRLRQEEAERVQAENAKKETFLQKLKNVTIKSKTSFSTGDIGYIEIDEGQFQRCTVSRAQIDAAKMDFALRIEVENNGITEELRVRSGDARLTWVTSFID